MARRTPRPGAARPVGPLGSTLQRLGLLALLAWAGLVSPSCSKRITRVEDVPDASRYPEGHPGGSALVAYMDTPNIVRIYRDNAEDPDSAGRLTGDDEFLGTETHYETGLGTVQGVILDSTDASRFEIYRREGDSFLPLRDFAIRPLKVYPQSHWDAFRFADSKPVDGTDHEYLGRGVVAGITNRNAPLTNVGGAASDQVDGRLVFTAKTGLEAACQGSCGACSGCPDSLLYLEWESVPGAAGYWLQVYQLPSSQGGEDVIRSGIPAPLDLAPTIDYLVAYLPDGTAARPESHPDRRSYRIGDALPEGGHLLIRNTLFGDQLYTVRVAAVSASGELLSYTGESGAFEVFLQEQGGSITFRTFPLGGVVMQPRTPEPPLASSTARASALASARGPWIVPSRPVPLGRRR